MGLEDRDWYREEPSRAWKDRWTGGRGSWRSTPTYPSSDEWSEPPLRHSPQRSFGGVGLRTGVWSAIAVSVVATAVGWKFDLLGTRFTTSVSAPERHQPFTDGTIAPPALPMSGHKIIRLGNSPGLDVPVSAVTRWSVSDPRFGTVSLYVPVGQTPRRALVTELAERGFQVVR